MIIYKIVNVALIVQMALGEIFWHSRNAKDISWCDFASLLFIGHVYTYHSEKHVPCILN